MLSCCMVLASTTLVAPTEQGRTATPLAWTTSHSKEDATISDADASCFTITPSAGRERAVVEAKLRGNVDLRDAVALVVDLENLGSAETVVYLGVGADTDRRTAVVLSGSERLPAEAILPRRILWNNKWDGAFPEDKQCEACLSADLPFAARPEQKAFAGMWGLPGGLLAGGKGVFAESELSAVSQVYFSLGERASGQPAQPLRVCNPRWVHWDAPITMDDGSEVNPLSIGQPDDDGRVSTPLVDAFGQRAYGHWPGKLDSQGSLADQVAKELSDEVADLRANTGPQEWTEYGGYKGAGQHEATGKFYKKKIADKWWLIDPEGYPFFSMGVTGVASGPIISSFEVSGTYGQKCPGFWGGEDRCHENYKVDRRGFHAICAAGSGVDCRKDVESLHMKKGLQPEYWKTAMDAKYGAGWMTPGTAASGKVSDMNLARLKSWGFNTRGAWGFDHFHQAPSSSSVFDGEAIPGLQPRERVSYTLFVRAAQAFLPGSKSGLRELLRENSLEQLKEKFTDFLGNENNFGTIAKAQADLQAKVDPNLQLKDDKYLIGVFTDNELWCAGCTAEDWAKYFDAAKYAVKKILGPNVLWLGCRFADYPGDEIARAYAKTVDVISFNWYHNAAASAHDSAFNKWSAMARQPDIDKPILIGEFHFGALDRSPLMGGFRHASSQRQKGRLFNHYVKTAVYDPSIIGCHWFRWMDQYVTGRTDGENGNYGILSALDQPHQEVIEEVRKTARDLYAELAPATKPPVLEYTDPARPGLRLWKDADGGCHVRQPVPKGWTWVAFPFTEAAAISTALPSWTCSEDEQYDLIKSHLDFTNCIPGYGWFGPLDRLEPGQSYQIRSAEARVLEWHAPSCGWGGPGPEELTVALSAGWNWVSLPFTQPVAVSEAMQGYDCVMGDLIKSDFEFTTCIPGFGWFGTLEALEPGRGYKIMVRDAREHTFRAARPAVGGPALGGQSFAGEPSTGTALLFANEEPRDVVGSGEAKAVMGTTLVLSVGGLVTVSLALVVALVCVVRRGHVERTRATRHLNLAEMGQHSPID